MISLHVSVLRFTKNRHLDPSSVTFTLTPGFYHSRSNWIRMHATVKFDTDACNQKPCFHGCAQRTFGQRMRAKYGANPRCAQPTSQMHATPLTPCGARLAPVLKPLRLPRAQLSFVLLMMLSLSWTLSYTQVPLPRCLPPWSVVPVATVRQAYWWWSTSTPYVDTLLSRPALQHTPGGPTLSIDEYTCCSPDDVK